MSDTERQEEQRPPSPTPAPTPNRGRGRGKGRGRGRRKGATKPKTNAGVKKAIPTGRRGRIKQYNDPDVQAAYERQRELKAQYQLLITHVKPALEDLASRNIEKLKRDYNAHRQVPSFDQVRNGLDNRLHHVISAAKTKFDEDTALHQKTNDINIEIIEEQFNNATEDELEKFYDAQLERLNMLEKLHDLGLPPDVRDDSYQYKMISEKEYDERGTYLPRLDGKIIPYPSRVPGTDMYEKAQQTLSEASKPHKAGAEAASKAFPGKKELRGPFKGRGILKRKALGQPDGQPGAKKPTTRSAARAKDDDEDTENDLVSMDDRPASRGPNWQQDVAPARHIMGILAAATDGPGQDSTAVSPEPSPEDEEEEAKANGGASDGSSYTYVPPRERTPEPPKGMCEPDEQGASLVQKGPKANNRIMIPPSFQFDDIDIGYRDSTNDSSKIKNASARGKFLDKPNTGSFHYDPLVWNYDARNQTEEDLDQELVAKHRLHKRYGLFLADSVNEQEPPSEHCTNPKPILFLTPSGRELHNSRTHATMVTEKRVEQSNVRRRVAGLVAAFCAANPQFKVPKLTDDHENFVPEEMRGPSLGLDFGRHASEETPTTDVEMAEAEAEAAEAAAEAASNVEGPQGSLEDLVNASIVAAAREASTKAQPAKAVSRPYDAIRDVFTSATPKPDPEPLPFSLAVLAAACDAQPRSPMPEPATLSQLAAPLGESKAVFPEPGRLQAPATLFRESAPMPLAMPDTNRAPMHEYPRLRQNSIPMQESSIRESIRESLREPALHEPTPLRQPVQIPEPQEHRSVMAAPQSAYGEPPNGGHMAYPEPYDVHRHEPMRQMSQMSQDVGPPAPPSPGALAMDTEVDRRQAQDMHMQDAMIDPQLMALEESRHQDAPYYGQPSSHSQPPPQYGPPPPVHNAPITSAPPQHSHYPPQHAPPPPAAHPQSRGSSYSSPSSAALPPLRPPRQYDQPPASFPVDPNLSPQRPGPGSGPLGAGTYYPPAPQRQSYHGNYPGAEQHHQPMGMNTSMTGLPLQPGYMHQAPASYHQPPMAHPYGSGGHPIQPIQPMHSPPPATSPIEGTPRPRTGSQGAAAQNSKYRELAPAPIPAHRIGWAPEPQLRTVGYNPTQDIKDYSANEPLPNRGPAMIRSWNINNTTTRKRSKAGKEEKDDSR